MLYFVIGNSGVGKTSYVTSRFGIPRMHGEEARHASKYATAIADRLNANGFNVSYPPKHLVYTYNFSIKMRSADFGSRESWDLRASNIGFRVEGFTPQFVFPGSTLLIDEMQEIFDSRNWELYGEHVSRWVEQCRKEGIDIVFIAQASGLGELRIRQLCEIRLIKSLDLQYDRWGNICKCTWNVDIWDRLADYEGKKTPRKERFAFEGDVFKYYDTNSGQERFFDGLAESDFEAAPCSTTAWTPEGIAQYVKDNPLVVKRKKDTK